MELSDSGARSILEPLVMPRRNNIQGEVECYDVPARGFRRVRLSHGGALPQAIMPSACRTFRRGCLVQLELDDFDAVERRRGGPGASCPCSFWPPYRSRVAKPQMMAPVPQARTPDLLSLTWASRQTRLPNAQTVPEETSVFSEETTLDASKGLAGRTRASRALRWFASVSRGALPTAGADNSLSHRLLPIVAVTSPGGWRWSAMHLVLAASASIRANLLRRSSLRAYTARAAQTTTAAVTEACRASTIGMGVDANHASVCPIPIAQLVTGVGHDFLPGHGRRLL